MRLHIATVAGVLLLLGTAGSGFAVVNCKQVNKYLDTGRTVKDVAETMVIDEAEVRKCQEQAAKEKSGGGGMKEEPKAAPEGEKK